MLWYNLSICVHYYVIACWLACLHDYLIVRQFIVFSRVYTAISIKVVHEQSGKVEYERERLLGIAKKLMNFYSDSQQPFALVFDFSALLVDNLN